MTFGLVPNDGMTLSCAVLTFFRPLTTMLKKSENRIVFSEFLSAGA
jgi:hypothetical protein